MKYKKQGYPPPWILFKNSGYKLNQLSKKKVDNL